MSGIKDGPRYNPKAYYHVLSALFDVDNTLVGNESRDLPSERFKQAVVNARGKIKIGLASARPLAKVDHILGYLHTEGLSILCNGAQIIDSETRSVIAEWTINTQTCREILKYAHSLGLTYWVNDDGEDYFPSQNDSTEFEKLTDIWDKDSTKIAAQNFTLNKPFVIVLHDITPEQIDQMTAFVEQHSDNDVTLLIAHETLNVSGLKLYDVFVVHKLANKKDALRYIAEAQELNIAEIMAVGDGRNDAVLVGSVGVGVAMGNSAQETLDVATLITTNREDDGAALVLEYALKNLTESLSTT
jgi:Cof subfamily protein (haloacid dehalogenase superfamily)